MTTYQASSNITKFARHAKRSNVSASDVRSITSEERLSNLKNSNEGLDNKTYLRRRLDDYDSIVSSSQLLGIDYSKFENHIFFDSAESKVNYAFTNLINNFPYDKNQVDIESFILELDGFSNYIYENKLPKRKSYLNAGNNFYVHTLDDKGKTANGFPVGIIKVLEKDTTIQFWVKPNAASGKYIVAQKLYQNGNDFEGFTIYLEENSEVSTKANLTIVLCNKKDVFESTCVINKSEFSNVVIKIKNNLGTIYTQLYVNGKKTIFSESGKIFVAEHSSKFLNSEFFIGAGNDFLDNTFVSNLDFGLDDFAIYQKELNVDSIIKNIEYGTFSDISCLINYKFNEPVGEHQNSKIVIDYSGKKTHGVLKKLDGTSVTLQDLSAIRLAQDNSIILYEKDYYKVCLYSDFEETLNFYSEFDEESKKYDIANPNLIFKLFPKYLFVEASNFEGSESTYFNREELGENSNTYLINLLLVWARFFDNLKCFVDAITDFTDISYDSLNNKTKYTSKFIFEAAKSLGYDFKEMFDSPTIEKLEGIGASNSLEKSSISIREIQNILWQRLLINTQDILRSKGTINSIKSAFNTFGVTSDKFFNIREYSSQSKINYNQKFISKLRNVKFFDFKGNIGKTITYDLNGIPQNSISLTTKDTLTNCDIDLDCCWTIEFYFNFNKLIRETYSKSQSLVRIINEDTGKLFLNLVYNVLSEDYYGTLELYVDLLGDGNTKKITINDVSLFSSDVWYTNITFKPTSYNKTQISLYADKSGKESEYFEKFYSSLEFEKQTFTGNYNILFGPRQALDTTSTSMNYVDTFEGEISNIKTWNTALSDRDVKLHVKDIFSVAKETVVNQEEYYTNIQSSLTNYTSLEEIIDTTELQAADNKLFNHSHNTNNTNFNFFVLNPEAIANEDFISINDRTYLEQSYVLDSPTNFNKINISSFENKEKDYNINRIEVDRIFNSKPLTAYENKKKIDIDFSIVKHLNEDINRTIDSYNLYTNYIINSTSRYEFEYHSFNGYRKKYFERLEKELDYKPFYQFFKYFDEIMSDLLSSLIPQNVDYSGFNLVVESHILERHKYQYKMQESRFPAFEAPQSGNYYASDINRGEFARIISPEES